jgi:hypothetical protein
MGSMRRLKEVLKVQDDLMSLIRRMADDPLDFGNH